jgi:peptidoglycan/xylan/chitin deacetylase (PgdA/CDA1 family)
MRGILRSASCALALTVIAGCGASGSAPGAAPAHRGASAAGASNGAPSSPPAGSLSVPPRPTPPPGYGPGHRITGRWAGQLPTFIPTARHVVALTFDAGANDAGVPSILRTLLRFHVAATFFLTGHFARSYPALARDIAADGFRIGNHTMTHPYLTHLSDAAVRWQILAAGRAITEVTGENPAPLFRFPYGDQDARTIAIANRLGPGRAAPRRDRLMHAGSSPDGSTLDAHALPQVISQLRARGYSFVTLDALLG